ncbi:MAG: winged helix-turn-helix transcriptional regulator [Candidatus Diapherotrites archaeon]|nr:winged helix-turn-helix transcriptional regulator [Candidatus Diapherotrites archaeon]
MYKIIKPKVEGIFSLLLENYNKSLTVKAISESQQIPYTTAFEIVNSLAEQGLVRKEKAGKAHKYRINIDSETTCALLNMNNTLRLNRAKIKVELPSEIKVDFLVLYNGKKVGVTRKSQLYELKGFDFTTVAALKNTLEKKPSLLNAITVPIGFDQYYGILREMYVASPNNIEDAREKVSDLDVKMQGALEMMADCIKKKEYNLAFESMYDAIRYATKSLALGKNKNMNNNYFVYLREIVSDNKELINGVENGFKKAKGKNKITAKDLTLQFKNVEKLLEIINATK